MADRIEQLLLHLQKELEGANVQYNNVSTMARIGNSQACIWLDGLPILTSVIHFRFVSSNCEVWTPEARCINSTVHTTRLINSTMQFYFPTRSSPIQSNIRLI